LKYGTNKQERISVMATATAKKVKIKPLDNRLVVKPDDPMEVTDGGIVLPDNAREKQIRGRVLAAGPGKLLDSGKRGQMSVRKGDSVYYGKFAGTEIELEAENLVVLHEDDVLAVVESQN
jgi:chaperonin GroES